ncbi:MAG: hypothetical protein KJT03_07040 [Verrucomicrobiae bacterium]|nr:hypothetical protein [Verrucomicrobiae bacterium]
MPLWGWFLFLPGLFFSWWGLSYAGATVLLTGSWGNGIIWGLFCFLLLGFVFWISFVNSPGFSLAVVLIAFFSILVSTQYLFYDLSKDRMQRLVNQAEPGSYPETWKQLDRHTLYQTYLRDTLEDPEAGGWLDHLRAHTKVGLTNSERLYLGEFEPGQPAFGPRTRRGLKLWVSWGATYLFGAFGLLCSMAGAALHNREVREEQELKKMAQTVHGQLREAMEERGIPEPEAEKILTRALRPQKDRDKITLSKLTEALGVNGPDLLSQLQQDLTLAQDWYRHPKQEKNLDTGQVQILNAVATRCYGHPPDPSERFAYHLLLVAAERLNRHQPELRFYQSMQRIHAVLAMTGFAGINPRPFPQLDLNGIAFRRVAGSGKYQPLETGKVMYYHGEAIWEELAALDANDIPESAIPAIIYQSLHTTDPRNHEWWDGTRPGELLQRLNIRARDALLTRLEQGGFGTADSPIYQAEGLLCYAGNWPFNEAGPLMIRAIECGWRGAIAGVPETKEWETFLHQWNDTPFGPLRGYVKWFDHKLLRKERGLE